MKNATSPYASLISLLILSFGEILILGAFNSPAAQDLDNVTISGRVFDQNAAVITGSSVFAIALRTGLSRGTITDDYGRYRFSKLEPGAYILSVAAAGFAKQELQNITTIAGQNLQLDITLHLEVAGVEPVTVTSVAAPILDTTRSVVGGTLTTLEVESLPISTRSALDSIFAIAGVTEEPLSTRDLAEDRNANQSSAPEEAGSFSIGGGPAYSNNLTIDGLDNNDDRSAQERFQPSIEAVGEVQVITNQFSAEYGRASGGRVNILTRGGSRDFRGRAFYFFKDESLNANTFRNNSLGLKRLPLQEHNAGFTLSGPLVLPLIKKPTATFFFSSYEFAKVLDSALIDTLVPVERNPSFELPSPTHLSGRRIEDTTDPAVSAEIAPFVSSVSTPLVNQAFMTRIDHQFGELHNGTIIYQLGRLTNLRQFGGRNRLAEALQGKGRSSDAISYSDNYVFSASTVNQARLQYSRLAPSFEARGGSSPVVLININDSLTSDDPARRTGTLIAGSSTVGATDRRESRFQLQGIVFHTRENHSLSFGLDFQRIHSTFIDLADASGTFSFASAGDFLAGVPNRYRQNFLTESTQRNTYLGVFVQDDWHPNSNVAFTFGLRYENESIVRDLNNFGPRFSVAFDPFKSGKTVARFGAGIFYNRVLLRTIDDFTLGAQQRFFDTNTLHDPITGKLLSAEQRRAFIALNLRFPETLQAGAPLVEQFGIVNTGFSRRLDAALRIPESYQANLGVEREIGGGFVFEANATFNRGIHLWREFNANAPVLPVGFRDFSEYLASRDFPNFRNGPSGIRPLYNATNAGELVRFTWNPSDPANPNSVSRSTEFGVSISRVNLNSFTSSTSVEVALAALNTLRPDPTRVEVEQLVAAGNSFYRGLTLGLRKRFSPGRDFDFSFRVDYTLSHLIDDGVVNTSDAVQPGDFRNERARSLLDRRHRLVFSGIFNLPRYLAKLRLSPFLRAAAGAPFNISIGGADRNLDDVGNDRPIFTGNTNTLRWRAPGDPIDPEILTGFALPAIGKVGNLPRNAGHGPRLFLFDLSVMREFRINEKVRLRPVVEFDNVLNKTVFSFGAEFINFNALSPTATPDQREAFVNSFLVATRTLRHRQIRLGLRLDF